MKRTCIVMVVALFRGALHRDVSAGTILLCSGGLCALCSGLCIGSVLLCCSGGLLQSEALPASALLLCGPEVLRSGGLRSGRLCCSGPGGLRPGRLLRPEGLLCSSYLLLQSEALPASAPLLLCGPDVLRSCRLRSCRRLRLRSRAGCMRSGRLLRSEGLLCRSYLLLQSEALPLQMPPRSLLRVELLRSGELRLWRGCPGGCSGRCSGPGSGPGSRSGPAGPRGCFVSQSNLRA